MQSHIHETKQGSKKSSRVFQILLRSGGGRSKKFRWGVFFYWVVGIWGRVNFTIWTFSRVKTTFCKYWTSIKIKITMTWVCKENEDKIKMVEEEWLQLKIQVLLDLLNYNMKIVIWWGEINLWCQRGKQTFGEREFTGADFSIWEDEQIFC